MAPEPERLLTTAPLRRRGTRRETLAESGRWRYSVGLGILVSLFSACGDTEAAPDAAELIPDPVRDLLASPSSGSKDSNPDGAVLAHGDRQLRRLLADRPAMALFVREGDRIWIWAANRFAGEGTGFLVEWNPAPPPLEMDACHTWPTKTQRARIQISNRVAKTSGDERRIFEEQWQSLAFEFFNLENTKSFKDVWHDALADGMPRHEWIVRNTRLEHAALRRTINFYMTEWYPWAERTGIGASTPSIWRVGTHSSYESWIRRYAKTGYLESWGRIYDERIVPLAGR